MCIRDRDYVKLSEAMGATARRVKTQEEFEKAFADALKSKDVYKRQT